MRRLIGFTLTLILPLISLGQNDSLNASSSNVDTSSVIPNANAPMVPPYSLEFFNNPANPTPEIIEISREENPGPPVFNPKISLGAGMLSFIGDLNSKHYQAPWTSRVGFDLNVSHRLNRYLQINFNMLFGKLGGSENLPQRHENFQSEIRAGGVSLLYDFGNFIPDNYKIRPWISVGATSFEFLSKTDLYDRNGLKYHYWSDGSIKNVAEGSPDSQNAIDLVRDYKYETDIRERNIDGFGKYPERAWAFPIGFGALMHLSERVDFKVGVNYYFSTTDYIDGITNKSVGNRSGTKGKDNFVYTSFAVQYDLVLNKKSRDTLFDAYDGNLDWLAIENGDYDKDGVKDFEDKCQGTPEGVKVDKFGCPLDEDEDGVPDYMDEENPSPKGYEVNMVGIALTDEFWQNWYDHYFDSIGLDKTTEQIGNAFEMHLPKFKKKLEREYTVELARYRAGVPSDEMAFLLSIGDMKSTILEDGSTVVFTAGTYEDVKVAMARRDEFIAEGNSKAKVGYFKNRKYFSLNEEDLQKVIQEDAEIIASNSTQTNTAISNTTTSTNTTTATNETNNLETNKAPDSHAFEKGAIVYRVQLGAYKNRISTSVFKNSDIVEIKTEDNYYRYVTNGYRTIQEAAAKRADLVIVGYGDAFVTAYKDGKRIAMENAGATMETKEKEDLNENKTFSSVDKSLINFKIQIGALKRPAATADMDERLKALTDIEKQNTSTGMVRYSTGNYRDYQKAEAARKALEDKGFPEAFIIATFKDEIISLQEAMELLK